MTIRRVPPRPRPSPKLRPGSKKDGLDRITNREDDLLGKTVVRGGVKPKNKEKELKNGKAL